MNLPRSRQLSATVLVSAAVLVAAIPVRAAESAAVPAESISVIAGAADVDGDRAAFQAQMQRNQNLFGGIEEYHFTTEGQGYTFSLDGHAIGGDGNYGLDLSYKVGERFTLNAGGEQFRTWYDGSGGYFSRNNSSWKLYDEMMRIDRKRAWIELLWTPENAPVWKLRVERFIRDGKKGSTMWADTNLTGGLGTRNIVPSYYDIDETRTVTTLDVSKDGEDLSWAAGLRYDKAEHDDKRNTRRRPGETASRFYTTTDDTSTDIFSVHAFAEKKLSEKLRVSAGGLSTRLDSNIEGTRIFGVSYDPVFDIAYAGRQARDEGYRHLEGEAEIRQHVFNLNAVYIPAKNWTVTPSIRFENMSNETMSEFIETAVQTNLSMLQEPVEADTEKDWREFCEAIEVRFTGMTNWTHSLRSELIQGDGELVEARIPEAPTAARINRESELSRRNSKVAYTANWYVRPGLTFAAQAYYKTRINDNDAVRDSTTSTADRYPAYITDQDFETTDFNVRLNWRPVSMLGLVSRYDRQRSKVVSQEMGLQKITSSEVETDIVSQSFTCSPLSRLYVMGSFNLVWDRLTTPASQVRVGGHQIVLDGENDYTNATLSAGLVLDEQSDLNFDYAYYRAHNLTDNSIASLPYGASEKETVASVAYTRRESADLAFTLKYTFATNRDLSSGNLNNFDAHILYGKVQYRF